MTRNAIGIHIDLLYLIVIILTLNVIDAELTLGHLSYANGQEANPFMSWVIQVFGNDLFVLIKMCIVMFFLALLLCLYNKAQRFVMFGLSLILKVYLILVAYHVILIAKYW